MKRLSKDFYLNEDVVEVARDLIGKVLVTEKDGIKTSGIITETEAYAGASDKASHAYGLRRTQRNEAMYAEGGTAYVFLCYGIHHLFNVVTNNKEIPHAVLIRALQPLDGIEEILQRRKLQQVNNRVSGGPGTLSQALGISVRDNLTDLTGNNIWLEDRQLKIIKNKIEITPRIGIDYAGEDAALPYRFVYKQKVEI